MPPVAHIASKGSHESPEIRRTQCISCFADIFPMRCIGKIAPFQPPKWPDCALSSPRHTRELSTPLTSLVKARLLQSPGPQARPGRTPFRASIRRPGRPIAVAPFRAGLRPMARHFLPPARKSHGRGSLRNDASQHFQAGPYPRSTPPVSFRRGTNQPSHIPADVASTSGQKLTKEPQQGRPPFSLSVPQAAASVPAP